MSFELNFEQLGQKLKRILNPSRFRFVVILYPNTNMIEEIKSHIKELYPKSLVTSLDLRDKSYQDISSELYKNSEGFIYINDFEELLNSPDLYNGFNQRRDKIASYNINLICFMPLYAKDELFTKAPSVIPDLWEFKDTVLELEKDSVTNKMSDIKISESGSYSSIGGLTVADKKVELEKLLTRLNEAKSNEIELNLLHQISTIYRDMGDYPKALEYYQKSLAIREKVLGKEHPDTATSYNNIGLVYYNMGDYPKALEYYQKALAIREKVLGTEHPSTATSYNNIGGVYDSMGDYGKALEYHQKALAINEKILGKEHPDTASSYNNIGGVYYSMEDYWKALEYHQKDLAINEKVLGKEHPDTATSYNNIGGVYYSMGDYWKALEYLQKALAIAEKVLGNEHPETVSIKVNLEYIKQKLGHK